MGMNLGLGVIVTDVSDGGLAGRCGLKNGDQLFQVKCTQAVNLKSAFFKYFI